MILCAVIYSTEKHDKDQQEYWFYFLLFSV
jgi:formate hydrogenlyase subunit 3/multisubunit Na+/H+ antiporter MnhD subunit